MGQKPGCSHAAVTSLASRSNAIGLMNGKLGRGKAPRAYSGVSGDLWVQIGPPWCGSGTLYLKDTLGEQEQMGVRHSLWLCTYNSSFSDVKKKNQNYRSAELK